MSRSHKKRKHELDLDAERTMYTSFAAAANAVSQLYTHSVQQQKQAACRAARSQLERILCYVVREHANSDHIPKGALLQFLQQEFEAAESIDTASHVPVQLFPVFGQGADGHCSQNEGMQKGARPPGRYSHAAPLDQDLDRHTMMECTNNHAAAHVPQPQVQQPHGAPAHMQASLHHMQAAMLGTAPGQQPGNFFSS